VTARRTSASSWSEPCMYSAGSSRAILTRPRSARAILAGSIRRSAGRPSRLQLSLGPAASPEPRLT
jgi:hypothetical protein